jgi:hypothetical protein
VPALLATRPMPISGVSRRTRFGAAGGGRSWRRTRALRPRRRRPRPAMAGRGEASTTRVIRWNASIVAAHAAESASIAAWRSSPAEKCSPRAAQHHAAHLRLVRGGLDRVGDAGHRLEVPRVAARLAVPGHDRARPRGRRW